MINCFAIDDEPTAIGVLQLYITDTPGLSFAGSTNRPLEFLQDWKKYDIDLLFLDVQMPKLSGFQLLKALDTNINFKVVLITGFADYALESYDFGVIDYIMKPVAYDRFIRAIEKYNNSISGSVKSLEGLRQECLFVKTGQRDQKILVYFDELDYIESNKNYAVFYCSNQKVVSLQSLRELETILPPERFTRVHNSYIINHSRIISLKPEEVVLKTGGRKGETKVVPISVKYRESFFKKIGAV
jgi:two-component system, LytTR family, response regulator